MKTKLSIITIAFLSFIVSAFTIAPNQILTGIFEGVEDSNYIFTVTKNDKKEKMTFNYLGEDVFEAYDLDSKDFIGKSFNIYYETSKELIENDAGDEEEVEYLTITKLTLNK